MELGGFTFLSFSGQWATVISSNLSQSSFPAISDQYEIFIFVLYLVFHKIAVGHLDDRKSFCIAFLAISDQYATSFLNLLFFHNGYQRRQLIVYKQSFLILDHQFRSQLSLFQSSPTNTTFLRFYFHKMPGGPILDFIWNISPFQINTQLFVIFLLYLK